MMMVVAVLSGVSAYAHTASPDGDMGQDRRDMRQDRQDLRGDRRDMREDRRDLRQDIDKTTETYEPTVRISGKTKGRSVRRL